MQAGTLRCAFERQQTGDSIGKFVSNRLTTQNVRFRKPVKMDQIIIDKNSYATGGKYDLREIMRHDFEINL